MSAIPLSTIFKKPTPQNGKNETSISGMIADLEQSIAQMKDAVRFWTPDGPTIGLAGNNTHGNDSAPVDESVQSSEEEEEIEEAEEMNWSDVMSASDGTEGSGWHD